MVPRRVPVRQPLTRRRLAIRRHRPTFRLTMTHQTEKVTDDIPYRRYRHEIRPGQPAGQ
jgi:hypothetical protein